MEDIQAIEDITRIMPVGGFGLDLNLGPILRSVSSLLPVTKAVVGPTAS